MGDLVRRKVRQGWINQPYEAGQLGIGVVLSRKWERNHYLLSVYYPKVNRIYDVPEGLMEVINETE